MDCLSGGFKQAASLPGHQLHFCEMGVRTSQGYARGGTARHSPRGQHIRQCNVPENQGECQNVHDEQNMHKAFGRQVCEVPTLHAGTQ